MGNKSRALKASEPYSEQFKPVFEPGMPTIASLVDNIYLGQQQESYDTNGAPRLHSVGAVGDPETNTVFRIKLGGSELQPTMRPVTVRRKENFQSYLLEGEPGSPGLFVMMIKQMADDTAFGNVRLLPFSTIDQISNGDKGGKLEIILPEMDIVKLNLTLKLTDVGEVTYATHKTEVAIEDITDDEATNIQRELNFSIGEQLANIIKQLAFGGASIAELPADGEDLQGVQLVGWSFSVKKWAVGLTLGAAAIATGLGALAPAIGISAGVAKWLAVGGGLGRNLAGFFGLVPTEDGPVMIDQPTIQAGVSE